MAKQAHRLDRLREMLSLQVRASRRRNELLAECQRLMEAGHRGAAKRCFAAAEELYELLTQLVRAVRRARAGVVGTVR
jgi:hypothetical protein